MAALNEEDIQLIVSAAQQDDPQAFELLVRAYERKTYAMARGLAGNDADAQDITQEAFVKLVQNLKSFQWNSSFNTWFYRLVYNTAIDFMRRRKRRETISFDDTPTRDDGELRRDPADVGPSPIDLVERGELRQLVATSLQELSEEQRAVLVMRDMQNASYEEIAARLSCPLGTVKSRIFRARAALKERVLARREQYGDYLRPISSRGGGKQ